MTHREIEANETVIQAAHSVVLRAQNDICERFHSKVVLLSIC